MRKPLFDYNQENTRKIEKKNHLLSFNEVFGDQGRQKWETIVR